MNIKDRGRESVISIQPDQDRKKQLAPANVHSLLLRMYLEALKAMFDSFHTYAQKSLDVKQELYTLLLKKQEYPHIDTHVDSVQFS
jgi:hypothetical protein